MKIILTESQLKTVMNERSIRYSEEEEYGIPEQIDWLNMQKEFMFIQGEAGHKVRLINNIIHNLQKIRG
jgi:signal recognition particle subunit SEC65